MITRHGAVRLGVVLATRECLVIGLVAGIGILVAFNDGIDLGIVLAGTRSTLQWISSWF